MNLKKVEAASHLAQVQTQIIDYAEAFFHKHFSIHSSLIFSRTRADLTEEWEQSPAGLNGGAGWLVPLHVDSCAFEQHTWSCIKIQEGTPILADFAMRVVSVVLFLDDVDEGGEFVFADRLSRGVAELSSEDYSNMIINGTIPRPFVSRSSAKTLFPEEPKTKEKASSKASSSASSQRVLLPPSRQDIRRHVRRALKEQRTLVSNHSRVTTSSSLTNDNNKFVKHVKIAQNESSYTVVLPRSRRLTLFESGRENVHAVMQIMSPHVHRFTLFMFLSEEK